MRAVWRYGVAFLGAAALLAALAGGLGALLGLRLNLTESLPRGIYRTIPEAPRRGSIVVCVPPEAAELARERGYLGPGSCPGGVRGVGKVVLATAGDVVTHRREAISVNRTPIGNNRTLTQDSRRRAVPHHPWGDYVLERDQLWLFSPTRPNAYDSRYFGPVRRSDVISVLRPLGRWQPTIWGSRQPTTDPADSLTSQRP